MVLLISTIRELARKCYIQIIITIILAISSISANSQKKTMTINSTEIYVYHMDLDKGDHTIKDYKSFNEISYADFFSNNTLVLHLYNTEHIGTNEVKIKWDSRKRVDNAVGYTIIYAQHTNEENNSSRVLGLNVIYDKKNIIIGMNFLLANTQLTFIGITVKHY